MAEKQSEHRQQQEREVVVADIKFRSRGQLFAFFLGMLTISGAIILLLHRKSIAGFTVLLGTLSTFIGSFLYGSHTRFKERKQKNASLQKK